MELSSSYLIISEKYTTFHKLVGVPKKGFNGQSDLCFIPDFWKIALSVEKIYEKVLEGVWRKEILDYLCRTFVRKIRGKKKSEYEHQVH